MKKVKIAFITVLLVGFASCTEDTKKNYHADHNDFKHDIEQMKIKLEATEAQLLNVSAELSELRTSYSNDSSKIDN